MAGNNYSEEELTPEQKEELRKDALTVYKNELFKGAFASLQVDNRNYGKLGEELYSNTILGNYDDSKIADFYNKVVKEIIADPRLAANRDTIGRRAHDTLLEGLAYLKVSDALELMNINPSDLHEDYKGNLEDYLQDAGEEFNELKSGLLEQIVNSGIEQAFKTRRESIEGLIKEQYSKPKKTDEESKSE